MGETVGVESRSEGRGRGASRDEAILGLYGIGVHFWGPLSLHVVPGQHRKNGRSQGARVTQEAIGFDWQPRYSGACGQYALQHALLLLGIPLTQRDVSRATRVPRWKLPRAGTQQGSIIKAIRSCGLTDKVVWTKSAQSARRRFDALLDRG